MKINTAGISPMTPVNPLIRRSFSERMKAGFFGKRFDTLELSEVFKNSSAETARIREMLSSKASVEKAETAARGVASYAYLERSLIREAIRTEGDIYQFSCYTAEKNYYQGLLDEADGKGANPEDAEIGRNFFNDRSNYAYTRPEDGNIDRDKVMEALADVNGRINSVMEKVASRETKVDMDTFNKCADSFAKDICGESRDAKLTAEDFDKIFGRPEFTEDNFAETLRAKADLLWSGYNDLRSHMRDNISELKASGEEGASLADGMTDALKYLSAAKSDDLTALISELFDEEEKAVTLPEKTETANEDNAEQKPAGRLTDKEIYEIFTGKPTPPSKELDTPFGKKMQCAGTEAMFDSEGNFIYKDHEGFVNNLSDFYMICNVFSGVPLSQHNKENLAKFYGGVAKRIDEAYASGRCSAEQKAELEKMMEASATKCAGRVEHLQAVLAIGREEGQMSAYQLKERHDHLQSLTPEERVAERKAQINKYIQKYFKIEKDDLLALINAYRNNDKNLALKLLTGDKKK